MSFALDTFLDAVATHLGDDVETMELQVEVGEWMNESPEIASKGWLGIYHQDISYEPRTLGKSLKSWAGTMGIKLVVQNADYGSGRECTLELQRRVTRVITAFMRGSYIGALIDSVRGLDVSFTFLESDSESVYFQGAILDFELAFTAQL